MSVKPLVTLDDRTVQALITDQSLLAQIPPLAEAVRKLANSPKTGSCGRCPGAMAAANKAGVFTLGHVKTVIGTLNYQHKAALKRRLNASRYRITYVSPGKRVVTLTT